MRNEWMLLAILLLPLLGALINTIIRNRVTKQTVAVVGSGVVFLAFALVLVCLTKLGEEPLTATLTDLHFFKLGLLGDQLSLWWMLVVTGVGFLIHVYSVGYMHDDPSFGRFFAKLNYFLFAMTLLVLSDNYLGLVIGWANVGLASYMLIGFYITKPAAAFAARKAFVMNVLGESVMIIGVYLIYQQFGTLRFDEVFSKIPEYLKGPLAAGTITTICLLLLVGAVAKSAQLPLHTWLPDAMQGPTPVSALIHAATMVTAGVYLVLRSYPLFQVSPDAMAVVAWIGALGAVFGALVACGQTDIKRVLAFSTMSQIGYMFLGAGVGAYSATAFHFLTHAFFKALLFLAAGVIIHELGGEQDIRRMGGLGKKMPFAYFTFLMGVLALIGVPGFAGFFSKDAILGHALASGQIGLWIMGIIGAGLTAFYNVRLFTLVFAGQQHATVSYQSGKRNKRHVAAHDSHGHAQAHGHHETPQTMQIPVALLAVLAVFAGWIGIPHGYNLPETFLGHWFERFGKVPVVHESLGLLFGGMAAVVAIAAVGAAVSYYLYGPNGIWREAARDTAEPKNALYKMFWFDALYDILIVQTVTGISDWVAQWFDPKFVDGIVGGLGGIASSLGNGVRKLQSGYVRVYALSVFVGVAAVVGYFVVYVK